MAKPTPRQRWQAAVDQLVLNWKLTADLDNHIYTQATDPYFAHSTVLRVNDLWIDPVSMATAVRYESGWQFLDALALFDQSGPSQSPKPAINDRPATQAENVW